MKQIEDAMDEKKMARIEAIILFHDSGGACGIRNLINPSSKTSNCGRCAGVDISEVNRLVKQFEQSSQDDETDARYDRQT